jgi:Protein of unknown function (DUF1592)/Protein of unknown function (DUF1588)/Protein of unknown function (DUF1587)/Protein of unknown function (DUF1585)/Protein of unknown function (DUF1595)/Planctomycete cytochrome C
MFSLFANINNVRTYLKWVVVLASVISVGHFAGADESTELSSNSPSELLKRQCFECHGDGAQEGNLDLDKLLADLSSSQDESTRETWWKVLMNLRAGTMPPPSSHARIPEQDLKKLLAWIKSSGMKIDSDNPDPGRVTLRRLNRREYANTIRDLLGVDFNADIAFPPDDTGFGFDNVGDALSLSPLVVEKYLAAASQIVKEGVPLVALEAPQQSLRANEIRGDSGNADNMRLNKPHQVSCSFEIEHAGQYEVEVLFKSDGSFEFSPQRAKVVCKVNGEELFNGEYGWNESKRDLRSFSMQWQPGTYKMDFQLAPIEHQEKVQPEWFSELDVERVVVRGPSDQKFWKHPRGYQLVFTRDQAPSEAVGQNEYAREILSKFGERAFRRPLEKNVLDRLVGIAEHFRQQPDTTFEASIAHAIVPMLASSRFLFRLEDVESLQPAGTAFPLVDEYSLASRLSYFIWSSMPDEQLFQLASTGQLRQQLRPTIARMLADRRSKSLVNNFVGQWLRTRDVEKTSIDPIAVYGLKAEYEELLSFVRRSRFGRRAPKEGETVDPEAEKLRSRFQELKKIQDKWNQDVRMAMRRETEMLFEFIANENRDLIEIIDPGYSFLNNRLASHYGIDGVEGSEMRRVDLPKDSVRGGILTHGTMLTVTSNPTRTSPVKRGLYVLENVLGTPTPPAPPNVPALEDSSSKFAGREPSLKELLAAHREDSLCSSCHNRMDPLGIALENFDALGVWRDVENEQPIDASGQLITGETFRDIRDLRRIIATDRRSDFYRCVAQKMLIYATGRGIEYYDEHTLDNLVDRLSKKEGKFEELIYGIIESAPFQRQRRQ